MAPGSTSTTPTTTWLPRVQRGPLLRGDDGPLPGRSGGPPGALRSADRGTEWALETLHEGDGWAAVEYLGEVSTGASALLVAGLAIRREATGEERYDQDLRRLGHFLLSQTEPTGAVLAQYDPVAGQAVAGEYSDYYTGEAYWPSPCTWRSPTGDGARQRTASARTSRPHVTRSRITGRRSPTTGPRTAHPRPSSSRSEATRR